MRIVLLCDNSHRELAALKLVKISLEKKLGAKVWIIGSIAEQQRIYFHLWKISPNCVFISQTVEASVRNIATYVKKSGAKLYILPAEISISPAVAWIFMSNSLNYDRLVDGIFLPGKTMKEIYKNSDISSSKLHIAGSPKIDLIFLQKDAEFHSRKYLLDSIGAPTKRKNIFIFSSFVPLDEDYAMQDPAFQGNLKEIRRYNSLLSKSSKYFNTMIVKVAKDFPMCNIFLKPHPLEKHVLKAPKLKNVFLIENKTLYNCINSIDLAIHWNSTVAVECWVRNIPTIQYIPLKSSLASIALSRHGNPVGFTVKEVSLLIKKHLNSPKVNRWSKTQKTYLKNNFFKIDGLASTRIAAVIKNEFLVSSKVSYRAAFSINYLLFEFLYLLFGKTVSRKLISLIRPFHWKYAAENDVYIT